MAVVLTAILVAVAIGGSMFWYYDTQMKAQELRISSLSNQVAQGATGRTAFLDLTVANDFDFIASIDANGGVAADDTWNAAVSPTLVIDNKDTANEASNVWITMWDPTSATGGVPTAIEDTTMSFYVTYNGVLIPLYLNVGGKGTYSSGVNIGTIPIGGVTSAITLSAKVDAAADDTYDDSGATYNVYVYVYQADAQSTQSAKYTLST